MDVGDSYNDGASGAGTHGVGQRVRPGTGGAATAPGGPTAKDGSSPGGAVNSSTPTAKGLTSAEAASRLAVDGPNAIPESEPNRVKLLLGKFWAPVPWLLEVAIVLELLLRDYVQVLVFAVLLAFNAVLAFTQEGRAQGAVKLLRERLRVTARVERDGEWRQLAADQLVVGDRVNIRQGDIVPADLVLSDGSLELDQSALTGESRSVSAGAGDAAYSGSVVVRGGASGRVSGTGAKTYFGRTAELVSTAHAPGNMERLIFGIVRALIILALVIVAMVIADGVARHLPLHEILPFVLMLVIASVPVALPATFTLATALGSKEMSERRVLVTRLAAIEEAASIEVLCTDKTGTLTQNRLTVESVVALEPFDELQVLKVAVAASDAATLDPLDVAILQAGADREVGSLGPVLSFIPFEPATKRSEAVVDAAAGPLRVVKGAPQVVAGLTDVNLGELEAVVTRAAATGARVLGIAQGPPQGQLKMVGLMALADPPREDASTLVEHLHQLGVRVVMVTGDTFSTAAAIASRVGIGTRVAHANVLRNKGASVGAVSSATGMLGRNAGAAPWTQAGWMDAYGEVLRRSRHPHLCLKSRNQQPQVRIRPHRPINAQHGGGAHSGGAGGAGGSGFNPPAAGGGAGGETPTAEGEDRDRQHCDDEWEPGAEVALRHRVSGQRAAGAPPAGRLSPGGGPRSGAIVGALRHGGRQGHTSCASPRSGAGNPAPGGPRHRFGRGFESGRSARMRRC